VLTTITISEASTLMT